MNKKDKKQHMLKHLGNIKLSKSQYIYTSIINYWPYVDNMFTLQNSTHSICKQLINVIKLKPMGKLNKMHLSPNITKIPKYNQIVLDGFSGTTFLLQQIMKQHQKVDHALNHISEHPNMANDTIP